MAFRYSAAQLTAALIKAMRDDEPDEVKEGIAALLAIHYPKEYQELELAVTIARFYPEPLSG